MNRFSELGKLKSSIMLQLLNNDNIVKCLVNNGTNFSDISLPDNFDRTTLLYEQIFPYRIIPDIQDEEKTFITMSFSFGNKSGGTSLKVGSIYFFVMMHTHLLKTDYGMIRYDYLISQIDEIFNATRGFGISKLIWDKTYDFMTDNKNYVGCAIGYKNTDFQ